MNLVNLLPHLEKYNKIIVTGPQRSGTTIATKIIATELKYKAILEENFREENLLKFVELIIGSNHCVIQAPALSSIVHLLKSNEIAVVFMLRPTEEILKSEKRIDWINSHDAIEKSKYFSFSDQKPISVIKREMWDSYQKKQIADRAFELEYHSLRSHDLWIDEIFRKNFHPRQTHQ